MQPDITYLNQKENTIVSSLAVLLEKNYSIPELSSFFQVEESGLAVFFDLIHDLSTKGFLSHRKGLYKLKSEVAKEILSEKKATPEICAPLLNYFTQKLENTGSDYEKDFLHLFKNVEVLLSKINGHSLQLARLSYLVSKNLVKFKKYEMALKYNQKAIKISESIDKRHPVVALFFRDKAQIYKILGDKDKALLYSLKDIEILEKHAGKYDDLLPDSYLSISKTYEAREDYEKAAEYGLKAIEFEKKKKRKKTLNISGLYHNLAYYYLKLNNTRNASLYINKAVEAFLKNKNKNDNHYKLLIRDQKRFNSLYRFEEFILKYRIAILIFLGLLLTMIIWLLLSLIF